MSKRTRNGLMLAVVVLAAAVTAAANTGLVKKVLSGDLVQVGEKFVARLTGIKAPQPSEPLGRQIYEFTKRELEGKIVVLITWTTDNTAAGIVYDQQDRAFVQVFYGKGFATSFNEVLLKKGYAWVDPEYLPADLKHYLDLEADAKEKGLGIWKARNKEGRSLCLGACTDFSKKDLAESSFRRHILHEPCQGVEQDRAFLHDRGHNVNFLSYIQMKIRPESAI